MEINNLLIGLLEKILINLWIYQITLKFNKQINNNKNNQQMLQDKADSLLQSNRIFQAHSVEVFIKNCIVSRFINEFCSISKSFFTIHLNSKMI